MKKEDAAYYAEQINVFTPAKAKAKDGELIVFLGNQTRRTRNEEEADELYRAASRLRGV